jgi:hypothetical protein
MGIKHLIVLVLLVSVLVGLDLFRTLRTGRARARGTIVTRLHQPKRYWRYVYASCALLAGCAVALAWMLTRPETFS